MTLTTSRRPTVAADERGQTMVEFVIVVPVLLMLLFGVIQFGIVYNNYLNITDATRVGARKAAVSRTAANPEALSEAAVRTAAADLDQAKLNVTVEETAWAHGGDVKVCANYPYEVNLLGFVVASGRVSSCTTERIE
jgi:Flp pilus assembly protein TadG